MQDTYTSAKSAAVALPIWECAASQDAQDQHAANREHATAMRTHAQSTTARSTGNSQARSPVIARSVVAPSVCRSTSRSAKPRSHGSSYVLTATLPHHSHAINSETTTFRTNKQRHGYARDINSPANYADEDSTGERTRDQRLIMITPVVLDNPHAVNVSEVFSASAATHTSRTSRNFSPSDRSVSCSRTSENSRFYFGVLA